ncbi:hypothetical protein [Nocardia asiatica]|uniref:hypothetical protein n=1 Tax=Nocardia asiatica TaxID=209252 RepID=UPI003EE0F7CD
MATSAIACAAWTDTCPATPVGAAIGIALMGSVFSSHYTSSLPALDQLPPAAAHAVESAAAAGLQVAAQLRPQGEPLATAVRSAFIDGPSALLIVVAVILALAALGALFRAPRTQTSPQ